MKKRNIFRIIWFSLVTVFFIWQWSTYQSRNVPADTFTNDNQISVKQTSDEITFMAKNSPNKNEIQY
ncbi:hypothetical protein [Lacihabitans lacunae]|uniref:Uncharacterized protein n=1 Tax=Lacihabitans lacunae TaxID=1028214 RepID=A0ABV7YQN3_9BACT